MENKCGKGWTEKPWWIGTDGLHTGYLVKIKDDAPMGGEIAYVYEIYQDFDDKTKRGVSLITESGRDTGGWSYGEQQQWLEPLHDTRHPYEFKNVSQLAIDYQSGYFAPVFKK